MGVAVVPPNEGCYGLNESVPISRVAGPGIEQAGPAPDPRDIPSPEMLPIKPRVSD